MNKENYDKLFVTMQKSAACPSLAPPSVSPYQKNIGT